MTGDQTYIKPNCVASAIFCAWGWRIATGEKVRLAMTHREIGVDHVQAQAFHRNEWTYLTNGWNEQDGQIIEPSKSHFGDEPFRYVKLLDFIAEQSTFVKEFDETE